MIYLDFAAAAPLDPSVQAEMQPYFSQIFANPSSLHSAGREANTGLEKARGDIAKVLGAKPAEIIFTSGSTEAANLVIQGAPAGKIVTSAVEHEAVLDNLNDDFQIIDVKRSGLVNLTELERSITDDVALICIQYANNEVGTVQ